MKVKQLVNTAVFSLATLAASYAHASLVGDTVTATLVSNLEQSVGPISIGVFPTGGSGHFFGSQILNFGATTFSLGSTQSFNGMFSTSNTDQVTLKLESLDFGTPITGVDFTSNLAGITMNFGSNFVNFVWNEQPFSGTYISAVFNTDSSEVPEPTTVALLGLGLLGFAASRRKAARK